MRPVRLILHEPGTSLGKNVYMKHVGSSYFSFVVCFIVPFIVKCSTTNKNTAESEEKRENYSRLFSAQTFLV